MITADQPDCFPDDLLVRVSSRSDRTMLDRAAGMHSPVVVDNRTVFCRVLGVNYDDVVYQSVIYDDRQTYDRIAEVGERDMCRYIDEVHADALMTDVAGIGLMLPIADCIGTVIYDPVNKRVALVHLGRHSTVADLMKKVIARFIEKGSDPHELIIWMSPSIKYASDKLDYFDHADDPAWQMFVTHRSNGVYLDMVGYNRASAERMGVLSTRIVESPIDTAIHPEYFSHRQGDVAGRFAILAMIR